MVSVSHSQPSEIPVIWLLPPSTLRPLPAPIRPAPIAISATLTAFILVILMGLFRKKSRRATPARERIRLANLKASIRVIRPVTHTPPRANLRVTRAAQPPPVRPERPRPQPQAESGSDTISDPQVSPYHAALKDIRNSSYMSNPNRPASTSTIGSYYYSSRPTANDERSEDLMNSPASSDYSVSIGPTPLPSRRNTECTREVSGAWTRLRLGSEYDGDLTFVPSEANLHLANGKGKARGA